MFVEFSTAEIRKLDKGLSALAIMFAISYLSMAQIFSIDVFIKIQLERNMKCKLI